MARLLALPWPKEFSLTTAATACGGDDSGSSSSGGNMTCPAACATYFTTLSPAIIQGAAAAVSLHTPSPANARVCGPRHCLTRRSAAAPRCLQVCTGLRTCFDTNCFEGPADFKFKMMFQQARGAGEGGATGQSGTHMAPALPHARPARRATTVHPPHPPSPSLATPHRSSRPALPV